MYQKVIALHSCLENLDFLFSFLISLPVSLAQKYLDQDYCHIHTDFISEEGAISSKLVVISWTVSTTQGLISQIGCLKTSLKLHCIQFCSYFIKL